MPLDIEGLVRQIDSTIVEVWIAIQERDDTSFAYEMRKLLELNRKLAREEMLD